MDIRIEKLNQYLVGWCGYYALAETPSKFKELDEWIRRRLRMCLWKQWKLPQNKSEETNWIRGSKQKAYEWGNTRKRILANCQKSDPTQNPRQLLLEKPRAKKSIRTI